MHTFFLYQKDTHINKCRGPLQNSGAQGRASSRDERPRKGGPGGLSGADSLLLWLKIWKAPEFRGPFLGSPQNEDILRMRITSWGLFWGPSVFGNSQVLFKFPDTSVAKLGA